MTHIAPSTSLLLHRISLPCFRTVSWNRCDRHRYTSLTACFLRVTPGCAIWRISSPPFPPYLPDRISVHHLTVPVQCRGVVAMVWNDKVLGEKKIKINGKILKKCWSKNYCSLNLFPLPVAGQYRWIFATDPASLCSLPATSEQRRAVWSKEQPRNAG